MTIIAVPIAWLCLAQSGVPEPIGLVLDGSSAPVAAGGSPRGALAAIFALSAVIAIAAAWWVWTDHVRYTPAERAFRKLCRRIRLPRADRPIVCSLADAHGQAAPVALLMSRSAFIEALGIYRDAGGPDAARAERIGTLVHGPIG